MESSTAKLQSSSTGGVRIVGKIRPFLESEANFASHIEVSTIDCYCASISFADRWNRRDSYKLDWCYGQDENMDTVFSKEIMPLVHEIVEGHNSCVIAYGAQGSGKTQLIKGSKENPGLALMAISKILTISEELNGLVTVSCYDVYQDRVYDLLDPKVPEVLVMEDASRKIMLKGLSQVPVISTSDFMSYYFHGCNERKSSQNGINEVASRNHRGLIVSLSYVDKKSNKPCVGKLNFIDLAGYEDTKRNSYSKTTLDESTRVNKSMYALFNVICSLNGNEAYIPYRETRLTHLLKGFLGKTNSSLLFTCLNPKPCPDTIHAVCLASRSCQMVNKSKSDSAKSNKSASRIVQSSPSNILRSDSAKNNKSASRIVQSSPSNGNVRALEFSIRKFEISQSIDKNFSRSTPITMNRPQPLGLSQKKAGVHGSTVKKMNEMSSTPNGRMMPNLKSQTNDFVKEVSIEDGNISSNSHTKSPIAKEVFNVDTINPANGCDLKLSVSEVNCYGIEVKDKLEVGCVINPNSSEIHDNQKQTMTASTQYTTITEKLREISNSLKLATSKSIDSYMKNVTTESMDPKYPKNPHLKSNETGTPQDILRACSTGLKADLKSNEPGTPQDILRARSTELKKSMVQECLTFINTASKEELVRLKGIGERRALFIIQRREKEPFKDVEDIKKSLGIGSKQIREMVSLILGYF